MFAQGNNVHLQMQKPNQHTIKFLVSDRISTCYALASTAMRIAGLKFILYSLIIFLQAFFLLFSSLSTLKLNPNVELRSLFRV